MRVAWRAHLCTEAILRYTLCRSNMHPAFANSTERVSETLARSVGLANAREWATD